MPPIALSQIAETHLKTRDYTLNALRDALLEVIACFPVYRTYINSSIVRKEDAQYIEWAIAQARRRSHAADKSVFDFIQRVLLIQPLSPESEDDLVAFVKKFQQYTAPVMAKGHEDTALYQYNRLITLNEVGGDPRRFGYSVNAFHFFNQERVKKWPLLDEYNNWAYTRLEFPADAPRHYHNIFTDRKLSVKAVDYHLELNMEEVLGAFPVALLMAS